MSGSGGPVLLLLSKGHKIINATSAKANEDDEKVSREEHPLDCCISSGSRLVVVSSSSFINSSSSAMDLKIKKPRFPLRFIVVIFGFWALFLLFALRNVLSVAIVAMVNQTALLQDAASPPGLKASPVPIDSAAGIAAAVNDKLQQDATNFHHIPSQSSSYSLASPLHLNANISDEHGSIPL